MGALHAAANITDPLSHGTLGDGLLSLNEAIQLHNGTLALAQLSPTERGLVTGFSPDISWIYVNATLTPRITVERDLDGIVDTPHGLLIEGTNGLPVIDFGASNVAHGFRAQSNLCSWRNLILENGPFGIDLQQGDASFGGTVVDNVVFSGQSQFAFAVTGVQANAYGRVLFDNCTISGTPVGIRSDEPQSGRATVFAIFHSRIQASVVGVDLKLGGAGFATCLFDSLRVDSPGDGIRITRYPNADRLLALETIHVDVAATNCLSVEGNPFGSTALALRMLDLQAANGGTALRTWPLGGNFYGVVEDSLTRGDWSVETGGGTAGLRVENCRLSAGAVTFGSTAAQPIQLLLSRFDGCSVTNTGLVPLAPFGCSFDGGAIQATASAPIQGSYCFLSGAVGSSVSNANALTVSPLGSYSVGPRDPQVGGSLTVQADLPPGLAAIVAIAPTADPPLLLAQPLHLYLDLNLALFLPATLRLQQAMTVPIPALLDLVGTAWVCQAAVLPDPGVVAPDLQLPPGRRFVLQ